MVKRAAKGSPTKGETITVRLDPKTKAGLELLARKQRRSLSGVIEVSCHREIESGLAQGDGKPNILDEVWHPGESQRFTRLAVLHPELLTYEEELLWSEIKDSRGFWKHQPDSVTIRKSIEKEGWDYVERELNFNFLDGFWQELSDELRKPRPFNILEKDYENLRLEVARRRAHLNEWDEFFQSEPKEQKPKKRG